MRASCTVARCCKVEMNVAVCNAALAAGEEGLAAWPSI